MGLGLSTPCFPLTRSLTGPCIPLCIAVPQRMETEITSMAHETEKAINTHAAARAAAAAVAATRGRALSPPHATASSAAAAAAAAARKKPAGTAPASSAAPKGAQSSKGGSSSSSASTTREHSVTSASSGAAGSGQQQSSGASPAEVPTPSPVSLTASSHDGSHSNDGMEVHNHNTAPDTPGTDAEQLITSEPQQQPNTPSAAAQLPPVPAWQLSLGNTPSGSRAPSNESTTEGPLRTSGDKSRFRRSKLPSAPTSVSSDSPAMLFYQPPATAEGIASGVAPGAMPAAAHAHVKMPAAATQAKGSGAGGHSQIPSPGHTSGGVSSTGATPTEGGTTATATTWRPAPGVSPDQVASPFMSQTQAPDDDDQASGVGGNGGDNRGGAHQQLHLTPDQLRSDASLGQMLSRISEELSAQMSAARRRSTEQHRP
jgi:hypothetical protein